MLFASDIDGVLCETGDLAVAYACDQLGLTFDDLSREREDYENGLVACFPADMQEEANRLIRAAFDENAGSVFDQPDPREGAVETLQRLSAEGRFAGYVTRRQPDSRVMEATRSWLASHEFPDAPLHFTPWGVNKAAFLKELDATVIVEDSPKEIARVRQAGRTAIVMDQPYNRELEFEHVRVSCWNGFQTMMPFLAWSRS